MTPNPKQSNKSQNKNWRCPRYRKCLDFAINQKWKGWHCLDCELRNEKSDIEHDTTKNDFLYYEVNLPKNRGGYE